MWSDFESQAVENAASILGVSRGGISTNKDSTWWNDSVKELIRTKRDSFKLWQQTQLESDRLEYKHNKTLAKRAVAQSLAESRQDMYKRLDEAKNDTEIFKIAKQRNRSTLDIKGNRYIRDKDGRLLTSNDKISERWRQYYDELLNEEFPRQELHIRLPIAGPIQNIEALAIPEKKKGRGRPPATWLSTVTRDLKASQINLQTTQDRASWRRLTRRADPK
ncbi:hypothetical protein NE865_01142 [Phthorimaea operculella]|nr:hypothetical protein NE865_01142 [Phthorimaea operculella]